MHGALRHPERQSRERWAIRLARLPNPSSARAFLEAFLCVTLPSDGPSRTFHLVWTSYAVLAMTDPDLARQPFVEGPDRIERPIAEVLRRGQTGGKIAPCAPLRPREGEASGPESVPRGAIRPC